MGIAMTQIKKDAPTTNIISPNYILLETWSTMRSTSNKKLVQNIQLCDVGEALRAYKNGGHQYYDHTATLKCLPFKVFLNDQSLATIISFDTVAFEFRTTISISVRESISRSILLDPLYLWFSKRNPFFLPSILFDFTGTRFSSLISTIHIWNASTRCSRPFQEFYKVYYFVARG